MARLRLVIDSNLEEVNLIGVAIHGICRHLGMSEVQASELELCIAEASTNVIRHAYHGCSGKIVSIEVNASIDAMEFVVLDTGTPMPGEQVKCLIYGKQSVRFEGSDTQSIPEGGRGLQIIHEIADEIAYVQQEDGNSLTLKKLIRVAAE